MTTIPSNAYLRTLRDRFDELDARRQRHGGWLGPDADTEYRRLGQAIDQACHELEADGEADR